MENMKMKIVINLDNSDRRYRRWARLRRYDKILKRADHILENSMVEWLFNQCEIVHSTSPRSQYTNTYIMYSSTGQKWFKCYDAISEAIMELNGIGLVTHAKYEVQDMDTAKLKMTCVKDRTDTSPEEVEMDLPYPRKWKVNDYTLKIVLDTRVPLSEITDIAKCLATPISRCDLVDIEKAKTAADVIVQSHIMTNSFIVVYHINEDWEFIKPEDAISIQGKHIYDIYGVKIIDIVHV